MAKRADPRGPNRYAQIIERIFVSRFQPGMREVPFERGDFEHTCREIEIAVPSNVGDVLYSFRYRANLPTAVRETAPDGDVWLIRSVGRGRYRFVLAKDIRIEPSSALAETKVPDATPGIISLYALSDEQALLAKVRYNRLIDIFTGVTCYSLQNHLRTTAPGIGQVEVDEVYVGLDRRGAHFVFPVQAKVRSDKLNVVQIEQDVAVCAAKFPHLICRPIGAQFMDDDLIALFELEVTESGIAVAAERHYRLVAANQIVPGDIERYRIRADT